MSSASRATFTLAALAALALGSYLPARAQTVLNFDDLTAMTYLSRNPVPDDAKLSDRYLATDGVRFSSGGGYVAVVALGDGHATSGLNGIGGSTPDGLLTYDRAYPLTATFFDPADPALPGVTDFVSVRGDHGASGLPVTLNAYDTAGSLIDSVTLEDVGGETLSLSAAGIHSVAFLGTGDDDGVALDDFTFDPVSRAAAATPEPSPAAALGIGALGLGLLGLAARRRKTAA